MDWDFKDSFSKAVLFLCLLLDINHGRREQNQAVSWLALAGQGEKKCEKEMLVKIIYRLFKPCTTSSDQKETQVDFNSIQYKSFPWKS